MAILSDANIAGYVKLAGWSGNDAIIAVAIALAESSGDPAAKHTNTDGSTDWGLFQINDKAHPGIIKLLGKDWDKPASNAEVTYKLWQKDGWGIWSTYKNQSYKNYLVRAQTAMGQPTTAKPGDDSTPGGVDIPVVSDGVQATKDVLSYAGAATKWLTNRHNWTRVAWVTIGTGLVFIGMSRTSAGQSVNNAAKLATKVVP